MFFVSAYHKVRWKRDSRDTFVCLTTINQLFYFVEKVFPYKIWGLRIAKKLRFLQILKRNLFSRMTEMWIFRDNLFSRIDRFLIFRGRNFREIGQNWPKFAKINSLKVVFQNFDSKYLVFRSKY